MPNTIVRKGREKDFPGFAGLLLSLANFEHLEPPTKKALKRIKSDIFGKSKKLNLLLAFSNEAKKSVGYALYFFTYSSFLARQTLYLEDLFVEEEFRHKGIGKELFLACLKEAKKAKCGRMEWSVLTWNRNAIDFYEKIGARRLNEWYYYRLDSDAIDEGFDRLSK